jgi:hypothetical protein
MCLYAVPLLLVAGIAYSNFNGGSEPDYLTEAMSAVSNKMSYNYGITRCTPEQHEVNKWTISCSSANTPTPFIFSVFPPEKAPYDVATSFYLIADNDVAKKYSNEGMLSFLMINTDAKSGDVKQLSTN